MTSTVGDKIAIRGEIEAHGKKYIAVPKAGQPGVYVIAPKPIV
jgi:hypothetical protein